MDTIEAIREILPEAAKDIKLNLQSVFQGSTLSDLQLWGTAVACSIVSRNKALARAVLAEAKSRCTPEAIDDAKAAAVLMGMNNVYYRFRHMIGKDIYSEKPARLRMNRIARPAASKIDFELYCLAVSAINGCEACIKAHEKTVLNGGMTEDQVNDAVRCAATIQAAALALDLAEIDSSVAAS